MATPKIGALVRCPADRGDKSFQGRITHVSQVAATNLKGTRYVWVTVRRTDGGGGGGVWPSHRLGFRI